MTTESATEEESRAVSLLVFGLANEQKRLTKAHVIRKRCAVDSPDRFLMPKPCRTKPEYAKCVAKMSVAINDRRAHKAAYGASLSAGACQFYQFKSGAVVDSRAGC
jgi:hypothetical protein